MQASAQQRGQTIKPAFAFRRVEAASGKWEVWPSCAAPGLPQRHVLVMGSAVMLSQSAARAAEQPQAGRAQLTGCNGTQVKDLDTARVHPSFRQYHVEQARCGQLLGRSLAA